MPLRRYQTPSRVRQTSSASILTPLVSTMKALPPCLAAIPGPLVEIGSVEVRECEAAFAATDGFGDGEGDGEGEATGDGDGSVVKIGSGDVAGREIGELEVVADVLRWLTP